jgi:hypothetical protein
MQKFQIDYHPHADDKIVISETEPPAQRLLLRMIDVQRLLAQANRTILSGGVVTKEAWGQIRAASIELGAVFEEDVDYAWESNHDGLMQCSPSPPTFSQKGSSRRIVRPRRYQSQTS